MFGWGRFGSCPALTPVSELLSKRRAEFCNWVGVAAGCGQGSVFRYNLHVQVLGKNNSFESWCAWIACLSVLEWPGWVTACGGRGESHEFIREAVTVAEGFGAEVTWG